MRKLCIITPTTGKRSLERLIKSVDSQIGNFDIEHILLWDDFRDVDSAIPESYNSTVRHSIVAPAGMGRIGNAPGSALRSIGLLCARSEWVTFADDDVWWDSNHLVKMFAAVGFCNWCSTLRKIWTEDGTYMGVDNFESVGDSPKRRVPYEMLDNNVMMFKSDFAVPAVSLYRNTQDYNDDRLMYSFLKKTAGIRATTNSPTINHVCPKSLEDFFYYNCNE